MSFTGASALSRAVLFLFACCLSLPPALASSLPTSVKYDGTHWSIKGRGVVCCPCAVPCPCRSNSPPSYGHCEATLFLQIQKGHYGDVVLNGVQVVQTAGMCAVHYRKHSALYFEQSASEAQQLAFMRILASFAAGQPAEFPYVREVKFHSEVIGAHLFKVTIPGTLEIIVDRDWGQPSPPMPFVAAPDFFSNTIQYAENLRYRVHDLKAGLDFDYSHRQANYRRIDLTDQQYRSRSMLIQFGNGNGGFTPGQMRLIKFQRLPLPDVRAIREKARRLRR